MDDYYNEEHNNWREILDLLARIREQQDYSGANCDFICEQLQSPDERVRGGAVLTAERCVFEPHILDLLMSIAEYDDSFALRKAAVQSLGTVISEGVLEGFEEEIGASTAMDDAEEWEEIQIGNLQNYYLRVKQLLMNMLEFEEEADLQELALKGLSNLGYLPLIREKIADFYDSPREEAKLAAVRAMGKFPRYWEKELGNIIQPGTPAALLKEAISASYSSGSTALAKAIEKVLDHDDPEVLRFALLTLSNINQTEELLAILRKFSRHENEAVREAAREGLNTLTKQNFRDFLTGELGMETE